MKYLYFAYKKWKYRKYDGDVIDCNIKSVTTFEQYCKIYKVTEFKKYNWFTIFSKLLFAKIFKIIGRIND